ncbi:MAG: zinc-binding dehydrogenase [Kocuria sp.]|nr:zinc-binding dehydrogenase [Kocuria sp.]MDO5618525.1 zinc-binding dehydrogenase [Kocuria sp.]
MIVRLSAQLPRLQGVLVEPLSIAWHAWRRTSLGRPRVAVVGVGGIGSAALVLARAAGALHVTATDLGKEKEHYAEHLGAECFLSASDPEDRARYGEVQADLTLVTNSHPSCLREALELTRPGGHVVVVSYAGQDVPIPLDAYVAHELTLFTSHLATRRDVYEVVALLEGGLDALGMIAHRRPIGEIAQAFEMLTAKVSRPAGRVILDIEEKEVPQ